MLGTLQNQETLKKDRDENTAAPGLSGLECLEISQGQADAQHLVGL